jgi:hypothetical protein
MRLNPEKLFNSKKRLKTRLRTFVDNAGLSVDESTEYWKSSSIKVPYGKSQIEVGTIRNGQRVINLSYPHQTGLKKKSDDWLLTLNEKGRLIFSRKSVAEKDWKKIVFPLSFLLGGVKFAGQVLNYLEQLDLQDLVEQIEKHQLIIESLQQLIVAIKEHPLLIYSYNEYHEAYEYRGFVPFTQPLLPVVYGIEERRFLKSPTPSIIKPDNISLIIEQYQRDDLIKVFLPDILSQKDVHPAGGIRSRKVRNVAFNFESGLTRLNSNGKVGERTTIIFEPESITRDYPERRLVLEVYQGQIVELFVYDSYHESVGKKPSFKQLGEAGGSEALDYFLRVLQALIKDPVCPSRDLLFNSDFGYEVVDAEQGLIQLSLSAVTLIEEHLTKLDEDIRTPEYESQLLELRRLILEKNQPIGDGELTMDSNSLELLRNEKPISLIELLKDQSGM